MRKCHGQFINNIGDGADSGGPRTRQPREDSAFSGAERNPVICYRCGQEGHYARGCAVRRSRSSGNYLTLHAEDRACEGECKKVLQSLSLFSISLSAAYHVTGAVNGTLTTFVVDTGAAVNLLRADL